MQQFATNVQMEWELTKKLPLSHLMFLLIFWKIILTRLLNSKKVLKFEKGAEDVRWTDLGCEFVH